jgi:hypothetical protein
VLFRGGRTGRPNAIGGSGRPDDRTDTDNHPGRDRITGTDPGHDRP